MPATPDTAFICAVWPVIEAVAHRLGFGYASHVWGAVPKTSGVIRWWMDHPNRIIWKMVSYEIMYFNLLVAHNYA